MENYKKRHRKQLSKTRGLSGYRARRQVADSQGHVLVAGLSLNKIGDCEPTPQPQGVMCGLP
jgi:hypothetical protein